MDKNRELMKRVLMMRRIVKTTGGGKIRRFQALVVMGNGNGCGGYGLSKAAEASVAIQKASLQAIKDLKFVERYDDRTVYSEVALEYNKSRINVYPASPGE